jgi:DNA invertase Pin-like site-specific DNA recombinase
MPKRNPGTAHPPIAIVYIRVANGGRTNETAIDKQRKRVREEAHRLGAVVTNEFADVGASGNATKRPGLQALLAHVDAHRPDYVVCSDLARLARNYQLFEAITDRLKAAGTHLAVPGTNDVLGAPKRLVELAGSEGDTHAVAR